MMRDWNKCLVLSISLLSLGALVGVVEGIRCYSCGTYITTSVTPCRNLSSSHLRECGKDDMFCSKYSNPAIQVYGCESKCEEKVQNSFEIHCCNEDKCNGGERGFIGLGTLSLLPLLLLFLQ